MPVQRLNHAVLYVRDVDRSVAFYTEALGFRVVTAIPGQAAFLQAADSTNDHDLGLFAIGDRAGDSTAGRSTVGPLPPRLGGRHPRRAAADPRGPGRARRARRRLRPRLHQGALREGPRRHRVRGELARAGRPARPASQRIATLPLHLEREIERYGAETRGGIGVSVPTT